MCVFNDCTVFSDEGLKPVHRMKIRQRPMPKLTTLKHAQSRILKYKYSLLSILIIF